MKWIWLKWNICESLGYLSILLPELLESRHLEDCRHVGCHVGCHGGCVPGCSRAGFGGCCCGVRSYLVSERHLAVASSRCSRAAPTEHGHQTVSRFRCGRFDHSQLWWISISGLGMSRMWVRSSFLNAQDQAIEQWRAIIIIELHGHSQPWAERKASWTWQQRWIWGHVIDGFVDRHCKTVLHFNALPLEIYGNGSEPVQSRKKTSWLDAVGQGLTLEADPSSTARGIIQDSKTWRCGKFCGKASHITSMETWRFLMVSIFWNILKRILFWWNGTGWLPKTPH